MEMPLSKLCSAAFVRDGVAGYLPSSSPFLFETVSRPFCFGLAQHLPLSRPLPGRRQASPPPVFASTSDQHGWGFLL